MSIAKARKKHSASRSDSWPLGKDKLSEPVDPGSRIPEFLPLRDRDPGLDSLNVPAGEEGFLCFAVLLFKEYTNG